MKKLTNLQRERIAITSQLAHWGLDWIAQENDATYNEGGVDTIGHMVACSIAQFINIDGVPTSDTIDALGLREMPRPSSDQIEIRIHKFIESLSS